MSEQDRNNRRKHSARRLPDHTPWPPVGFVTLPQFMHALGLRAPQTVYSYVQRGLLPQPDPIGPNRVGWRVDVARRALEELPDRVRRNGTGESLTARRMAGRSA